MPVGAIEGPDKVCSLADLVYFVLLLRMRPSRVPQEALLEKKMVDYFRTTSFFLGLMKGIL